MLNLNAEEFEIIEISLKQVIKQKISEIRHLKNLIEDGDDESGVYERSLRLYEGDLKEFEKILKKIEPYSASCIIH